MRTLTPAEAKTFYNRFGSKQDGQSFYETAPLERLVANGSFEDAHTVVEFGCGTGRFALDLLRHRLPPDAVYRGVDISETMVGIARSRLAPFASRAAVELASDTLSLPAEDSTVDRLVSTYVLDLLSESAMRRFLAEARRVLRPRGRLCLAGITHGSTPLSRLVMGAWQWIFGLNPSWVGGCRPTRLADYLVRKDWNVHFRDVVVAWGVASEVLVASPLQSGNGLSTSKTGQQ
jgi:ubiquinone/menaquinone biosynthesis C-methylase UbiE